MFNPNPGPGDIIIPRNFGQGPGSVSVNISFQKVFGFGPPPSNIRRQAAADSGQGDQPIRGNRGGAGGGPRGGGGGGGPRGGGGGGGGGGFGGDVRHKYNLTFQ